MKTTFAVVAAFAASASAFLLSPVFPKTMPLAYVPETSDSPTLLYMTNPGNFGTTAQFNSTIGGGQVKDLTVPDNLLILSPTGGKPEYLAVVIQREALARYADQAIKYTDFTLSDGQFLGYDGVYEKAWIVCERLQSGTGPVLFFGSVPVEGETTLCADGVNGDYAPFNLAFN